MMLRKTQAIAVTAFSLLVLASYLEKAAGGVTLTGSCAASGSVSQIVRSILASHPEGGAPLSEAITAAVVQSPDLAQDVIHALRGAEGSMNADAGEGLAQAQIILGRSGSEAADRISQWMACASPALQTAYYTARATRVAGGGWPFGPSSTVTGGVVSPSKP